MVTKPARRPWGLTGSASVPVMPGLTCAFEQDLAYGVGAQPVWADRPAATDPAEEGPGGDPSLFKPRSECRDWTGLLGATAGDRELSAFATLIGLGALDEKLQPVIRPADMRDVQCDEFRSPQRSGIGQQEQGAVARARQIRAADPAEFFATPPW